jgi:hypothetical protein
MTLDAAVTLARELAISAGIGGDVVSAERRGFRVVVDVGAAMAYVASDDAGGRRLGLERQLLRVLQTRVPVGLPVPLVDHPRGCLRLKVQGRSGFAHHRRAMTEPAVATEYAGELARVMAAFHTAIGSDEFATWLAAGLPGSALLERADVELAASTMAAAERDKAVAFLEQPVSEDERCFLHGDFGSHNLVVDERGRITGVFDIEEAALGDRHHDMRWLPSYGPAALRAFVEAYQRLAVPIDIQRILRRHALAALEQLGWGLREPELHYRTGRTLAQTRAWAVEALARAPRF